MRRLGLAAMAAAALAFAAAALTAPSSDDLLKDEKHFYEQSQKTYEGGNKAGSASNMEVVGHNDLGGRGFNGDVWTHEGYAYVGHWGFADWATGNDRFCPEAPDNGIAVIDARNPANPVRVATLQNPAGTSAEDVVVYTARYGPYAGRDIAASGIQWCGGPRKDPAAARGLMLWDVTNPAAPVQLGFLDTGCCTRGVHEFEVAHRADLRRTFAYATVPTSRYPDTTASGYRDEDGDGDFRLIDITNPTAPFQASDWGIQDIGGPFSGGQGCDPDANYGHGADPSEDGKLAFVAYWDSGFVQLDLTNPASPVFKGRTVYGPEADGDAHSAQYDEGRKLLFTADEDFCKASGAGIEKGFGYMRVYDVSKPSAPKQIGSYRTPNSLGTDDQAAGDFVIHNNFLVGTDVYSSWYTDGVRVVDVSNPRAPKEVANFVPPATSNPVKPSQRGVLTNTTQVWGVVVDEATGLVYASDMNSGLWIVKRTG
ncbi:MAG: hypothetical protein HY511_03670 [Actinobacteria bacterium]|nr:hypothetical protein [Actinomycetota bacterium]